MDLENPAGVDLGPHHPPPLPVLVEPVRFAEQN